jgi:hypothetical protein
MKFHFVINLLGTCSLEQMDLFQFSTARVAQFRAGPPQIVRGNVV